MLERKLKHETMMYGVTILGATGSIGVSTLDVIQRNPDRFQVIALTANRNVERLLQQCLMFKPRYAVMADKKSAQRLRTELQAQCCDIEVLAGIEGLETVAALDETDYVMAAIVGAAGLLPTLAAARAGKRILLANKEALVMSGALFMETIEKSGAVLLPVDSEHNAIFQCMPKAGQPDKSVEKILLTASGGPFRTRDIATLKYVTPEEAVAHPNWDMGRKISVDSATMMNKGLEVIEACWLFNVDASQVEVVIHPQSTIHSMVAYNDGSVLAELGEPDMRTPIAHALAWPERIDSGVPIVDMLKVAQLNFEAPDFKRFPCLKLAYQAHQQGSCATIALNAANEIAVDAFLQGQIRFTAIAQVVEDVLEQTREEAVNGLEAILQHDKDARRLAQQNVQKYH